MQQSLNESLLREYVRSILKEDESGGNPSMFGGGAGMSSYDMGFSGMGGGMGGFGGAGEVGEAFLDAFLDPFKTAVAEIKGLAVRTKKLLWVGLQTVLTTLIPIYGYNYASVFDEEKEELEKIKSEYKDVYDRTDAALSGPDAKLFAFMASPALVIGSIGAKATAKTTKALLSAASGGLTDDAYDKTSGTLKKLGRWALGDDGGGGGKRSSSTASKSGRGPKDFFGESQLTEEEDTAKGKKKYTMDDLVKDEKLMKKMLKIVAESPKAKEMAEAATAVYRKSLKEVYDQAEAILRKARTVEDIEKIAGKKATPELKKQLAEIKKLPAEEKAKATKTIIEESRKATKKFYVEKLKARVKEVVDGGVPKEAKFVKEHLETIQKIEAL